MNADYQARLIRTGKDSQFAPPVRIPASALVAGVYTEIDLPMVADMLWLPQMIVLNDTLIMNPAGPVIGLKLNSKGSPTLPWGRNSNLISRFDGAVDKVFATLLYGTAADFYLMCSRNCEVYYSGNFAGAGTPDNTTTNATTE